MFPAVPAVASCDHSILRTNTNPMPEAFTESTYGMLIKGYKGATRMDGTGVRSSRDARSPVRSVRTLLVVRPAPFVASCY